MLGKQLSHHGEGFFFVGGWGRIMVGLHTSPPLKLTRLDDDYLPHVLIEGLEKTAINHFCLGDVVSDSQVGHISFGCLF